MMFRRGLLGISFQMAKSLHRRAVRLSLTSVVYYTNYNHFKPADRDWSAYLDGKPINYIILFVQGEWVPHGCDGTYCGCDGSVYEETTEYQKALRGIQVERNSNYECRCDDSDSESLLEAIQKDQSWVLHPEFGDASCYMKQSMSNVPQT